ncbi:energy transducer TonB [Aestuariispira insulae]|uniref:TonB family protein n=1 Tax=Aestuariispira insulae TaxID=1461337 RepID=A0A3D9H3V6_9PROT|nr:energy transducer TonB [Aestuariispira insulae]RED44162.1 TonB family protein [Aestuariispira insulae]
MDILTADGRSEKAAALTGALFLGLVGIAGASQLNLVSTGETVGKNVVGAVIMLTSAPTSHPVIEQPDAAPQVNAGQPGSISARQKVLSDGAVRDITEPSSVLEMPPPAAIQAQPTSEPLSPIMPEIIDGTLPVALKSPAPPRPPIRPEEPVRKETNPLSANLKEPVSRPLAQPTDMPVPEMDMEKRDDQNGTMGSPDITAPTRTDINAVQAIAAAAPVQQASSGASQQSQGDYWAIVSERLNAAKRYPRAARKRGIVGTAILSFTVESNGRISTYTITESSGSQILDRAVLAMIREVGSFPPFPDSFQETQVTRLVPVAFHVE